MSGAALDDATLNDQAEWRLFQGGQPITALSPHDRGLAYGDGVFETMRVHDGLVPWWPAHASRLNEGAQRLRIALPDHDWLTGQVHALATRRRQGVLKLVLTRGCGGRGYAPPPAMPATLFLSLHALPAPAPATGLRLRWCQTRLALQPLLAGIKHCNRLEQVLARAEWDDPGIDDGLLCDSEGQVVCATAGNVFARIAGRWITPPVQRCGVAGRLREWLLTHVDDSAVAPVMPTDIENAEALFIGNAVRGILPVTRLGERVYPVTFELQALRQALATDAPMFADTGIDRE